MMKVKWLCSDGRGFAEQKECPVGTTVQQFVERNGANSEQYVIRHNGQLAIGTDVLQEGDRVSATPKKITGA